MNSCGCNDNRFADTDRQQICRCEFTSGAVPGPELLQATVVQLSYLLYFSATVATNALVAIASYDRWTTLRRVQIS